MSKTKHQYKEYKLDEIHPQAREIAVEWIENFKPMGGMEIEQKVKLASDMMNFAQAYMREKLNIGFDAVEASNFLVDEGLLVPASDIPKDGQYQTASHMHEATLRAMKKHTISVIEKAI